MGASFLARDASGKPGLTASRAYNVTGATLLPMCVLQYIKLLCTSMLSIGCRVQAIVHISRLGPSITNKSLFSIHWSLTGDTDDNGKTTKLIEGSCVCRQSTVDRTIIRAQKDRVRLPWACGSPPHSPCFLYHLCFSSPAEENPRRKAQLNQEATTHRLGNTTASSALPRPSQAKTPTFDSLRSMHDIMASQAIGRSCSLATSWLLENTIAPPTGKPPRQGKLTTSSSTSANSPLSLQYDPKRLGETNV